ncbi:hypothetical protein JOC45_000040 [Gordonia hydrophobica]|nr:hypothetical protein [Gordonia hydrophobica]
MDLNLVPSSDRRGAVAGDDDVLDGRHLRHMRFQEVDQRRVDDDDPVFRVIDHVDQLLGEQPDVQGMEDRPHRRHRQIRLEMLGVVPHERRHALVGVDSEAPQSVCEGGATTADVGVASAAGAAVGHGDDFGGTVDRAAVAQQRSDRQVDILHGAQHEYSWW